VKEKSTKVKNNHKTECTTSAARKRCRSIDITVIDTSIDGWKATKKLTYGGEFWEVANKKSMLASEQEDAYEEKEKMTASQVTTLYAIWYLYKLNLILLIWRKL